MDSVETSKHPVPGDKVATRTTPTRPRKCLSCGTSPIKPGRRYCSKACRHQINWVLSLSNGLLKTFNARYAAFSFTHGHVILDVLPVWSKEISRFICRRSNDKKPAEDLKNLILESGREWYHLVDNNNSRSYASLSLLTKNHKKDIDPGSIKPDTRTRPRLSKHETGCLKILKLDRKDLSSDEQERKIKTAYKRMAKLHHPDVGGDAEKFRQLAEAHQQMLLWAQDPQYTSRRALHGSWSYDGYTNRWSPPL
ncbi:MAG: DnaJ domain-containing protein [Desulfatiglandaceae bacterium]